MAQNKNFITQNLSGRIGDIIYYVRNGKQYCRQRPQYGPDSMSPASRESSRDFARAVKAAKAIRSSLNGIWQPAKDETAVYRLNKAVYAALRQDKEHRRGAYTFSVQALQTHLKGFRYNRKADQTIDHITTSRLDNGNIELTFCENWQDYLRIPRNARYIQLQAIALDMDLTNHACLQSATAAACIPLGSATRSMLLPATPVTASATIILLQLRFLQAGDQLQTAGPITSEQAFIACVLESANPACHQTHKTTAAPTSNTTTTPAIAKPITNTPQPITQKRATAFRQRSPQNQPPPVEHIPVSTTACKPDSSLNTAINFPLPATVNNYKKLPELVNVE